MEWTINGGDLRHVVSSETFETRAEATAFVKVHGPKFEADLLAELGRRGELVGPATTLRIHEGGRS